MKPKPQPRDAFERFPAHFARMLNPGHELVLLANQIDWSALEAEFVDTYCPDLGVPAKAVRLLVGLHDLQYAFDESDDSVVARWVENPYWRCFLARGCGDAINAVLAAAGANLCKLLGLLRGKRRRFVLALHDTAERLALTAIRWLEMLIGNGRFLRPPHSAGA